MGWFDGVIGALSNQPTDERTEISSVESLSSKVNELSFSQIAGLKNAFGQLNKLGFNDTSWQHALSTGENLTSYERIGLTLEKKPIVLTSGAIMRRTTPSVVTVGKVQNTVAEVVPETRQPKVAQTQWGLSTWLTAIAFGIGLMRLLKRMKNKSRR